MRETREISMALIDIDRLPLNETGLATTLALKEGVYMPPIKVAKRANGRFLIRDGRHRYLAHKLLGRKTIKARMSVKPYREENKEMNEKSLDETYGEATDAFYEKIVLTILRKDFPQVIASVDPENPKNIEAIASYYYNHIPAECWESPTKVRNWIKNDLDKNGGKAQNT